MFVRKLEIMKFLALSIQKSPSFQWRKLLAAISILVTTTLVFWSLYTSLELLSYTTVKNNSLISNLNDNTSKEIVRVYQNLDSSIEQKVSHYCQIKGCTIISCSSILEAENPGTVVSNFIETKFKVDCKNMKSVTLSFNNCKFPENTLRRNWLHTSLSIEELTFESCYLNDIEDNAFSSSIYESTKKITVINNKLVSLRKAAFNHLDKLQQLTIQENIIKLAEFNLLQHVAGSITILELYGAIDNLEVLRNITGADALLKLQILSIRGNSINTISAELFTGVPAVKSLYLDNSNIKAVSSNTLQPMASSIQQLILNNNNIASLPAGLLDSILSSKRPFCMVIQNNPWHCDCKLKWMQDLVQSHSNVLSSIPICSTPRINAGKAFTVANFCNESISTSTTVPIESSKDNWNNSNETTTQIPQTTRKFINVSCSSIYALLKTDSSRKLLSTDFLQVRSRSPNFYVSGNHDWGIMVNLPNQNRVTLLWFDNDDVEGSLSCAKNVKHSYLLRNIDPQTAYTICLLDDNEDTVSPLNCLAVTTKPAYEFRPWLTNADKSLVISISIFSLVLLFLFGGFLSFLLMRRHPSLLRGSKRVVLVKRRNVDAIVLPKGVNIGEEERRPIGSKTQEDGYITPLPPARISLPRRSRMSRMSSQSDRHSYVSEVEPMETCLDSWRLSRVNNEMEKRNLMPPPVPPYPNEVIPSLSLEVDAKHEHYYQSSIV